MSKFTLFFLLLLTACSVSDALKGTNPPDLSGVHEGANRLEVKKILGHQKKIMMLSTGERLYIYQYQKGRESSIGRVAANSVMDIATLGLWEFTSPSNENLASIYITYDENDNVASINKYLVTGF